MKNKAFTLSWFEKINIQKSYFFLIAQRGVFTTKPYSNFVFVILFFLKIIFPSTVQTFLKPCLLCTLLSSSIQRAVKPAAIDTPESFNFFLCEKTFLRWLFQKYSTIIALFFCGLGFPIWWILSTSFFEKAQYPDYLL